MKTLKIDTNNILSDDAKSDSSPDHYAQEPPLNRPSIPADKTTKHSDFDDLPYGDYTKEHTVRRAPVEENHLTRKSAQTTPPCVTSDVPSHFHVIKKWLKLAAMVFVCVLLATMTEAFVFNWNFWSNDPSNAHTTLYEFSTEPTATSHDRNPRVNGNGDLFEILASSPSANTDAARLSEERATLENSMRIGGIEESSRSYVRAWFYDLPNIDVSSLSFDVMVNGKTSRSERMEVTVSVSDSGMAYGRYVALSDEMPAKSCHVSTPLTAYGYVKQLEITVEMPSSGVDISLENIQANTSIPFSFSWFRFLAVLTLLLLACALRPGSCIWKIRYRDVPALAIVPTALMLVLLAGAFVWDYDIPNPSWYSEATGASDEYAALASAICDDGNLYLATEPPEYMQKMDDLSDGSSRLIGENNIYDPTARDHMQKEAGLDTRYKLDAAYFNGHYYVYFGVVPVLLAYIPYHVLTGGDLGNTYAACMFLLIFCVFAFLDLEFLVRRKYRDASCGALLLGYAGILLASAILYSVCVSSFYNVPVTCALALLSVGTYLLLRAAFAQARWTRWILVFFGVLFLVLTLGARPQVVLGGVLAGIAYLVFSIREKRISWIDVVCAIVPVITVIGMLLWYNYARFGSPFDFGANYNMTGNDMTLRGHSLIRGLEGMMWYMFGTPEITANFPFMERYMPEGVFAGRNVVEMFACGLFFLAPFTVFTFVFAASQKVPRLVRVFICASIVGAFFLTFFDAEGAGIVARYTQDFGYLLGAAFAVGIVSYDNTGADGRRWRLSRDGAKYLTSSLPFVNAAGVNGTGVNASLSRAPRFHSIYAVASLLMVVSLVMSFLLWCTYANTWLPDTYFLDWYGVKLMVDAWGTNVTPLA